MQTPASQELRAYSLAALRCAVVDEKLQSVRAYADNPRCVFALDVQIALTEPSDLPGRPERPALLPPKLVKQPSIKAAQGHVAVIHALAHIEFNAVNLALDAIWRFPGMPADYYWQWWQVACEEAYHFQLLQAHLRTLGSDYGALSAHNSLWEMVERTNYDVLARMALVPRTMEARGLDASPPMRAKLLGIGDEKGAAIIDIILRDEIGHVAIGNHWFRWCCAQRGLDPLVIYPVLAEKHNAPKMRPPHNIEARRLAGFVEAELQALGVRD